jgi:cytochrome c553
MYLSSHAMKSIGLLGCLWFCLASLPAFATDQSVGTRDQQAIRLLLSRCAGCHGEDEQQGNLRLDRRDSLASGGDSGPLLPLKDPSEHPLIQRITASDPDLRMPPEGEPLSSAEVELLRQWLLDAAPWEKSLDRKWLQQEFLPGKEHWAWKPLNRPTVPPVDPWQWSNHPIDRFIADAMQIEGVQPMPQASLQVLARRMSADVLGLPLDFEQLPMEELNRHEEGLWLDRQVDAMLASPRAAERWARHWLDVVRFADSDGFETNQPRPNAYRYRDYVLEALRHDLPYDQFVRDQIAGDQYGKDAATGFLVGGPWDRVKSPDPVLTANQRADELHDMVSTTGSVFLGITIGCARCHDHKFDPVSQRDYYAIKACLSGVQHGERQLPQESAAGLIQPTEPSEPPEKIARRLEQSIADRTPTTTRSSLKLLDDTPSEMNSLLPGSAVAAHADGPDWGQKQQDPVRYGIVNLGQSYTWWNAPAKTDVATWRLADHDGIDGQEESSDTKSILLRIWVSWGAGWPTHAPDASYWIDSDGNLATPDDQTLLVEVDQRYPTVGSEGIEIPSESRWSGLKDLGIHSVTDRSVLLLRSGSQPSPVTADMVVIEREPDQRTTSQLPALRSPVDPECNIERIDAAGVTSLRMTIDATNGAEPCIDEVECYSPEGLNIAPKAKLSSSGDFPGNAFHKLEHLTDGIRGNARSWISNQAGKGWVQLDFASPVEIAWIRWSRDGEDRPVYRDRLATAYRWEARFDSVEWRLVSSHRTRMSLPLAANDQVTRDWVPPQLAETLRGQWLADWRKWQAARAASRGVPTGPMAYAGRLGIPEPVSRLHRGDPMQPRESVPPAGIQAIGTPWALPFESGDAERRTQLAHWIASPGNPLTARVLVNRLWLHHFGRGLVGSPSDFGTQAGVPSHPELLDWLACELIERDWSLQAIHRLILTSATYRQQARHEADARMDRLYVGFTPRRLEAEPLRDAILWSAGNLDLRWGGPGFDLFQPNTNYVKVYESLEDPGPETWRRMIYQSKPRMQLESTFGPFDCPDAGQVTPKRNSSITPLQSLSLLHSPFLLRQAKALVDRSIEESDGSPSEAISRMFQRTLGRLPQEAEWKAAQELSEQHGLVAVARALLNSNEFLYLD